VLKLQKHNSSIQDVLRIVNYIYISLCNVRARYVLQDIMCYLNKKKKKKNIQFIKVNRKIEMLVCRYSESQEKLRNSNKYIVVLNGNFIELAALTFNVIIIYISYFFM
jgi:hypothetical protein